MKAKNILLVEENYVNVISVQHALAKLAIEYTLHVAHNGAEALAMLMGNEGGLATIEPDIILLDINMKRSNGRQLLTIIKDHYTQKEVRIFVMTTSNEKHDHASAEKLGISGYILKPLDLERKRGIDSSKSLSVLNEEFELTWEAL